MEPTTTTTTTTVTRVSPERWKVLMHRWFIQYNPLYLVSAALVLVGVILLSHGVAGGGTAAQLGITAIAEVYAWALIGGAALLVKINLRRPAVMLALLAALYQCDLTLHTETCALLGISGMVGSVVWWLSFVAKLRVLARAMSLRVSRSVWLVTGLASTMVVVFPWLLRVLDADKASALLGAWLFAVVAVGLWSNREVTSDAIKTPWQVTVARRSLSGTWAGFLAMLLVHVGFWFSQHPHLDPTVLLAPAALLSTRWLVRERSVWIMVGATLTVVVALVPDHLAVTALLSAAVFVLRALRQPLYVKAISKSAVPVADDVYRAEAEPSAEPAAAPFDPITAMAPRWRFVPAPLNARIRLLTGAAACSYLALWTVGWAGGAWPAHRWWLDVALLAGCVLAFRATRSFIPLAPVVLTVVHGTSDVVPTPRTPLEWGIASVTFGFGLLLLSLAASVHWRSRRDREVRVSAAG